MYIQISSHSFDIFTKDEYMRRIFSYSLTW